MSLAVLLNPNDPIYNWEHLNAHRELFGYMAPLTRFSRLPYQLDPSYSVERRAGPWNMDHDQAHLDFIQAIPNAQTPQNFADSNLKDRASFTWWNFITHQEHHIALTSIPAGTPRTYPFW